VGVLKEVDELLLYEQYRDLNYKFPKLSLLKDDNNLWLVKGILSFSAEYSGHRIDDEYSIELMIPEDFPENPPKAREIGGRIPRDFHHFLDDSLCLGAPLAIKKRFKEEPTLLSFVDNSLIPYLYSFTYFSKYGKMPFGELSHGWFGILEYYQEIFNLKNNRAVLGLINILAEDNYRGHKKCPCGSKKRLRSCHGSKLLEIKNLQPESEFKNEYRELLASLVEK
jgi:hypothetical protein